MGAREKELWKIRVPEKSWVNVPEAVKEGKPALNPLKKPLKKPLPIPA